MSSRRLSASRLRTIYARQAHPGWDETYLPSICATPSEAPSISRAYVLTPGKLEGRQVHLLSKPELSACLLGLYHPDVIGLQEQRMLSPEPAVHPLSNFPGETDIRLPPLKGVIDVADRLGYLPLLPTVKVFDPDHRDAARTVVFPWAGDLLFALKKEKGGAFLVNWTIKSEHASFKRPVIDHRCQKARAKAEFRLLARHEIEIVYYQDAGIPTFQLAGEDIDHHVVANLRQLFLHHRRKIGLTAEQYQEILHRYAVALESGIAPGEVILSFTQRQRFSIDQVRSSLYQAIWNRQLRVDLFRPILINVPLHPETKDVLDVYGAWFRAAP